MEKRIYQIAKELNISHIQILKFLESKSVKVANHMAFVNNDIYDSILLEFSKEKLSKKGVVVSKLFMGEEFEEIKIKAKKNFKKIHFFKPDSSRDESRETYIHCSELST